MPPVGTDANAPLFSLPVDGGAGTLLGMAAGDALTDPGGRGHYSVTTQLATVLAYHVIERGEVDPGQLVADILLLDGLDGKESVYRRPGEDLATWLASARLGLPSPLVRPACETSTWVAPLGMWFRDDPAGLVEATVAAVTLIHGDGRSSASGVAVAGAVAGSCFAQSGADLVLGAAETVEMALGAGLRIDGGEARAVAGSLRRLAPTVADASVDGLVAALGGQDPGLDAAIVGIILAASRARPGPEIVVEAGRVAGGCAAAVAGAIVGARMGLVRWPWLVANDTWFAEIGRRLIDHSREVRDLPVPFAVEQHLALSRRLVTDG